MGELSAARRRDIVGALRRGTVPARGLAQLAVGLDRLVPALDEELDAVTGGGGAFKAVRAEYGGGKTFLARWLAERAQRRGLATSEVQISEAETPLHRLETVYRRLMERLATADEPTGALGSILDRWGYALEGEVLAEGSASEHDEAALLARTSELMEQRLAAVGRAAAPFAAAVRARRHALARGDRATAQGLLAWVSGQPNVAASVKRAAQIKGEIDHFGALAFLQALLVVLRDAGHPGLLLVLDEVETLQRVRSDVREKGLNALRQLVDEVDAGRFPGLLLVVTGTPAFFDGPQGMQRLPPLAQRLATDFQTQARWDNPRAPQVRLSGFDHAGLVEVGVRVRDIYADGAQAAQRVRDRVDDAYVAALARAVTGSLGGQVGIAPRLFLKKLIGDVLDRVDQFDDFDPREHYALTLASSELTAVEVEAAAGPCSPDDVRLDL